MPDTHLPPRFAGRSFVRRLFGAALVCALALPAQASAVVAEAGSPDAPSASPETRGSASSATRKVPTSWTAGVGKRWSPKRTVDGDLEVSRAGQVIEDVRVLGDLVIDAPDVTVRRVDVVGGTITNYAGGTCHTGLVLRSTTVRTGPGQTTSGDEPAIGVGGYTARDVKIVGHPEGFRVGGKDECGPVRIINSFAKVVSPDDCGDWHGDALQGYDGAALTVRNSVLKLDERDGCGGTAPFFYPSDQGNTSVSIDGLVVEGGGYPFRLGEPGDVRDLRIVRGSWYYGPINVACSELSTWDATIVDLGQGGQPIDVRNQPCNSNGGE